MAAYYTECQGSRGTTSRLGGAAGGVRALVQSWTHAVSVRMFQADDKDSGDHIRLTIGRIHGDTLATFDGTIEELVERLSGARKGKRKAEGRAP